MSRLPIASWPDALFAGRQNAFRVQGILQQMVELRERVAVRAVGSGDLVHEREVRAVLAIAGRSSFAHQDLEQLVCTFLDVRIAVIENQLDDVVQLSPPDFEGPFGPLQEVCEADFDRVMDINVKGVWLGMKYQIRHMLGHEVVRS